MEKKKAIMKIESFSHKDGRLLLFVNDWSVRAMLKGLVEWCEKKYGGYIKLELSPPYKPRSIPMNDKYWAMCTEFGNFLGMTKDEVSMGVKYRAMDEGLWEGEIIPFSNGKKIPMSTADSDTKQMSVLIEVLYRIAAEYGYEWKDI